MTDIAGQLSGLVLKANASVNASANGTGVDISDFEGSILATADINAVSGTTPTLNIKYQSSPDNSAWTDISGAALTEVTTAASKQTTRIDTRGGNKYLRAVMTLAGTTPVYLISINAVGLKKVRS